MRSGEGTASSSAAACTHQSMVNRLQNRLPAGCSICKCGDCFFVLLQAALQLQSQTWRLGLSLGFVAGTTINIWLAYLTHQQFGWRVHSRIPCDFRRKHVAEKRHLYIAVNRWVPALMISAAIGVYWSCIQSSTGLWLCYGCPQPTVLAQQCMHNPASWSSSILYR